LPSGRVLGGATLNFSYRLNSLGVIAPPVSRVGEDELGNAALETMWRLDMPVYYVQHDPARPTGTVPVTFENGQPRYLITPDVAYDYIEPDEELYRHASDTQCLYYGTLAQRSERSRATLLDLIDAAPDALKFLDINLRKDCYTAAIVRDSLRRADVVKMNDEEIAEVASMAGLVVDGPSQFARSLIRRWKLRACVITLGATGSHVVTESGEDAFCPGYKVEVADTIGAGDAFAAGFVSRYLIGASGEESARFGNILGALAASKVGGTAPISAQEIQTLASSRA
jgi:fructokinase